MTGLTPMTPLALMTPPTQPSALPVRVVMAPDNGPVDATAGAIGWDMLWAGAAAPQAENAAPQDVGNTAHDPAAANADLAMMLLVAPVPMLLVPHIVPTALASFMPHPNTLGAAGDALGAMSPRPLRDSPRNDAFGASVTNMTAEPLAGPAPSTDAMVADIASQIASAMRAEGLLASGMPGGPDPARLSPMTAPAPSTTMHTGTMAPTTTPATTTAMPPNAMTMVLRPAHLGEISLWVDGAGPTARIVIQAKEAATARLLDQARPQLDVLLAGGLTGCAAAMTDASRRSTFTDDIPSFPFQEWRNLAGDDQGRDAWLRELTTRPAPENMPRDANLRPASDDARGSQSGPSHDAAPGDTHARDPRARDPHARDPHARDPRARDPHARDQNQSRDPTSRPPLAADGLRDDRGSAPHHHPPMRRGLYA